MRVALDHQVTMATQQLTELRGEVGEELVDSILEADQHDESGVIAQRLRVEDLKQRLAGIDIDASLRLLELCDVLVVTSVWIVGGDGWAYDIGYGGLDHTLASGRNVNVLVLDTEVYSNTGGQQSKATPIGAVAKFAAAGKSLPKKDLGQMAMSYEGVYVAKIAMGANDRQTLQAFIEAASWDGPSIIIAYSHCIAHGYDMRFGLDQQNRAVKSGYWPLYRYDPRREQQGKNPLQLDSKAPSLPLKEYMYQEGRFSVLKRSHPERAAELLAKAELDVSEQWDRYERRAQPWNGK